MNNTADLLRSVAHYRDLAPGYDHYTRRINRIRERAIEALQLRPGQTVLDAGCGTGWCIPRIAERVGRNGTVIGFDPSPQMLVIANSRLPAASGTKVSLIEASAQTVTLPSPVDAILFSYTHDVIRSREALDNTSRLHTGNTSRTSRISRRPGRCSRRTSTISA